ncbi:MAG: hypothetical protein H7A23_10250 [Leptospiraceae bacterium]|nr:hypothetical protein [Leptospiraceae bacterium]MCP5494924.1 hypothetical protein [Leptospiraceae bacterium]
MDQNFEKARILINEREFDDGNLDKVHDFLLTEILKEQPDCSWAYGLLSEVEYWRGEIATKDKLAIYEKGVEFGKKGVEKDPNNIESNFWLGVNYGLLGHEKGIISSLFLITPIENSLKKSMEIDEKYFYGGPHRAIGWFYHMVPPWPIANGDSKKGLKHLEKALEIGPSFYLNHIYISEVLIALREKKRAREHLDWILNSPLSPKHKKEDERYKEQAKQIMKKL